MELRTDGGTRMNTHARRALRQPSDRAIWPTLALAILTTGLAITAHAQWMDVELLPEDVELGGRRMEAFTEGQATVTVVRGDFRMRVGQREIRGQDAVIWTQTGRPERREGRLVTVYVEGDAQIREPGGAVTRDETMLIRFRHEGRFVLRGGLVLREGGEGPLLDRAREALESYHRTTPQVAHRQPPVLIYGQPPQRPDRTGPQRGGDANDVAPPVEPNRPPTPPAPAQPVYFRADSLVSEPAEPNSPERITYARGSVYLSQGNPEEGLFLQLQGQRAVIFSVQVDPNDPNETTDPLAGAAARQRIVGAYLEEDVVISVANRTMRASRAYYDFVAQRATVLDTVFRSIQEQRDIPIYIRSPEARMLSRREMWFRKPKVSTSDFYTPTYHIGASEAYVMDATPRLGSGEALGPESMRAELKHATFNVRGVPVLYWPYTRTELTRDTTALRKIEIGGEEPGGCWS